MKGYIKQYSNKVTVIRKMNIDKFGRVLNNEENRNDSFKKNTGIFLSPTGNYNALQKRIENLAEPTNDKDAVNAEYVLKQLKSCMRYKRGGYYDAKNNFIKNVKDPVEKEDVVNKRYLESLIPIKLLDGYSLGNIKLKDVAFPTSPGDGVNLHYITKHCIQYNKGVINGDNSVIKNIKDGVDDTDASSVGYVNKTTVEYNNKLQQTIRNLAYELFHHIHGSKRATSTELTETNYLDWNKILL